MKRKVIIMGGKTAVISLPASWIKKFEIHKGDELDIQEKGKEILIKITNENSLKRQVLDIREIGDSSMIWNFIPAAYISGADEIEIYFKNNEQKDIIEQCVSTMIGFGIVDEKENYIRIKDITGAEIEFDPVFRRIFLMLNSIVKEGFEALTKNNFEKLSFLKNKDYLINFNIFFCLRYIFKNDKENVVAYSILNLLESMGDRIADTYEYISINKVKVNKTFINIFENAKKIIEELNHVYYISKKEEKIKLISNLDNQCEMFEKLIKNEFCKLSKDESIAISYIHAAIGTLRDTINLLLAK